MDVVDDLGVFEVRERDKVEQGEVRILIKTNRCRSVYVLVEDLDLCMLVMLRQAERMGVPHADISDEKSALADAKEWFDTRTSCWHVRLPDSREVVVSDPVRRTGINGAPLEVATFKRMKSAALAALKASSQ